MGGEARTVVVVGASAAGLRCACRLARLQPEWRITVVEAKGAFSYAACGLPYVLSGDINELEALRRTPYGMVRDAGYFRETKGVEVLAGWRATEVDTASHSLRLQGPEGERELGWDELVLATGAAPRRLPGQPDHPRVCTFHVWGDVAPLHRGLAQGEIGHVALVGAGLVGCELAEAFRGLWGAEVTLIESAPAPLPGVIDPEVGACVAAHLESHGVQALLRSPVERIEVDDRGVTVVAGAREVRADAAVVAVGVEPATTLARRAGAALGPTGAVAVDERLATSVPHVWAVGDCAEVRCAVTGEPLHLPLGSLANREGRTLANVLAGRTDAFPPVAGAVAVKVFDWNVAAVGATADRIERQDLPARSVWITAEDRPHYWPEYEEIHLKMTYDPGSRRVLGVQAAGKGEVVKRIDVATQLIDRGATLEDFAHLEHAYAPPYAPALDPLAVLAFAAQNQEDGVVARPPLEEWGEAPVLDVRLSDESEQKPLNAPRVTSVPLHRLRDRLGEIEKTDCLVVCERGTRSSEAVRLLNLERGGTHYLGGGQKWRRAAGRQGDA